LFLEKGAALVAPFFFLFGTCSIFKFMNQENLTQFIRLFTLADAEASQRITERLSLVLRDPAAYQKEYAEELAERGIETKLPAQELRDVALIDALWSEDLAWENDWKDSLDEMAQYVNETLIKQGRTQLLDENALALNAATGPEALDVLQDALEPLGLALVLLTLGGDSYPLSIVAEADAETTRQLAAEFGFKVAVY
jgi:hypothetical protein